MKRAGMWLSGVWLACACQSAHAGLAEDLAGRGIWVNGPAHFDADKAAFLQRIGVRRVHFMLSGDIPGYADCSAAKAPPKTASASSMLAAIEVARVAGLKVILTSYVPPAKQVIDQMLESDSLLAGAAGQAVVTGVEYDLEGQWAKATPCGFTDHRAAVDYLIARTRAMRAGLAVGVTVHYGRLASARIGIDKFDWVAAQAYSKCAAPPCAERGADIAVPPKGDASARRAYETAVHSAWDNPHNQPGTMQRNVARRLGPVRQLVIVGLPAYSQVWNDKHTVEQAMQLAHDAVNQLRQTHPNYVGENYWALTNVLSSKSHPHIRQFLAKTADPATSADQAGAPVPADQVLGAAPSPAEQAAASVLAIKLAPARYMAERCDAQAITDWPDYQGRNVMRCQYGLTSNGKTLTALVYLLNPSAQNIAARIGDACDAVGLGARAGCGRYLAQWILNKNGGQFPVSGFVLERKKDAGGSGTDPVYLEYRDGSTINSKDQLNFTDRQLNIDAMEHAARAPVEQTRQFARIANATRADYRRTGGTAQVGNSPADDTLKQWPAVIRENELNAQDTGKDALLRGLAAGIRATLAQAK